MYRTTTITAMIGIGIIGDLLHRGIREPFRWVWHLGDDVIRTDRGSKCVTEDSQRSKVPRSEQLRVS